MCTENVPEYSFLNLYSRNNCLYYGIDIKAFNPWKIGEENENCKRFINECFIKGQKARLLDFDFKQAYLDKGKHAHTASLYLLGIAFIKKNSLIQNSLETQLKTFLPYYNEWYKVKSPKYNKERYDFLYTWYLTALYHDVASCIENIRIPKNPTERQKNLEYYLGELDITYSPYGEFPHRKLNIPHRFSENLIKNYFYYRANHGSCEHGILAGYLFFDRFVKNFLGCCQNKKVEEDGFIEVEGDLKWHIEQLSHAAYVADAIICHNIWMGGERDTELYQAYGLSPLLYMKHSENKLSIKNYPLQFMLCLWDTIEPIKRFGKKPYDGDMEPKDVLSNIYLEFWGDGMIVRWDEKIKEQKRFQNWKESLEKLENWMEVKCEVTDTDAIISWNTN